MSRHTVWATKVAALIQGGNSAAALAQIKVAPTVKDLKDLRALLSAANLYFADQAPWGLKADLPRMGTILVTTADVVRRAAIVAQPFIPASAAKFLDALAVPAGQRLLVDAQVAYSIPTGATLPPPEPVFKKFEHAKAG